MGGPIQHQVESSTRVGGLGPAPERERFRRQRKGLEGAGHRVGILVGLWVAKETGLLQLPCTAIAPEGLLKDPQPLLPIQQMLAL
jgi:hypothetical protein